MTTGRGRGAKPFQPPRVRPDRASTPLTALPDAGSLRVVLLSDAIPSRNGVGTYYDDLADHLRDRVDEVVLLCPPSDAETRFDGLAMTMPGDPTQKLYWPSPWNLWQQVREVSPNVIVSGTPGGFGVLGLLFAALLRTAFCVGFHTEMESLAGLYWTGRLSRLYRHVLGLWDRMILRFGANVLVMNESLRDQALDWGVKHPKVMGTPIQKSFLERPTRPLAPRIATVTYVGRLAPEKELLQVRDAARALPDLRFRLAGDGPMREEVEGWNAHLPNLEYMGWCSRNRVMDLLDDTELLVLPSRFETFGTVAFEAMIRGRLVLVSHNCGIVHWPQLSLGLFRLREGELLTQAIPRLQAMAPEERAAVAETGMREARAAAEKTVEEWVEVLRHAVLEKRFN